jgi:hypothetical protein
MNIDRITPMSIRKNEAPVEDMLEGLESFANTIGGPAWRQRRARSASIERSIALYLDEDQEFLDPDRELPDIEADEEEVSVAFTALRVAPDPDDDEMSDYSNVYKLSYSTSLPLISTADMPAEYRQELDEEIAIDSDTALIEVDKPEQDESHTIFETNTLEYTVYQVDGSIEYDQFVEYNCGDINIKGACYSSKVEATSVHHPDMDKHSEEWLAALMPIPEENIGAVGDQILIMNDLEKIISSSHARMELLGQSSEVHAIRVLAILSLISNGIRPYRPKNV